MEVVDSQHKFELNLGRAVDALKNDYPNLLTKNPNWKIYHSQLEVIDPTGVTMRGLENYKVAFSFVHAVVRWFYCESRSGMTRCRVGYDWARRCIRVSWNVEIVPKMIYGGTRNTLHVDGISEYHLDRDSGLITEHRVTHLLINDQAVRPANGIFNALKEFAGTGGKVDPEGIPVFSSSGGRGREDYEFAVGMLSWTDMKHVEFHTCLFAPQLSSQSLFLSSPLSSISSEHTASPTNDRDSPADTLEYTPQPAAAAASPTSFLYDMDAYQRKNASRQKFGKPPLTPEEYIAIEEEVRAMDTLNKKKATYLAEQLAQQTAKRRKDKEDDSFLSNIFGGVFKNGCESNFDCERPQVCCDVGFKRICCSNGLGIVEGRPVERYERGLLRVPLPNDNYDY